MNLRAWVLPMAKRLFRAVGLEVSFADTVATEENTLRTLFRGHEFRFVLDVGANTGQYGQLVRRCGYRGAIVSFEPLTAAYGKLVACAASDPHWTVADRCALGAERQRTSINIAGNSASSSLLDMSARHSDAAPHSAIVGIEQIDVVRLDDCIERYVGGAVGGLLKIDTQGYELEVLRGAQRSLTDRIEVVQVELSLVQLYDGQPLLLDTCNLLKQYGFTLRHIVPGFKDPATGSLLQLDGILVKN